MAAPTHGPKRAGRRIALALGCSWIVLAVFAGGAEAGGKRSCSIAAAPGEQTVPLSDQGRSRPFLLYVPDDYEKGMRLPLVVNLHSSGSDGSRQMEVSGFAEAADAKDVAVVAPDGAVASGDGHSWNVPGVPLVGGDPVPAGTPDDERYLLRVIAKAKRSVCIARKRVFFTGYSGGARMTSQMACDHADKIAAIAPVAGIRSGVPKETADGGWEPDRRTCRPSEPVSVIAFHGTADTVNPYAGNDDARWGYSVEQALDRWAAVNGCRPGPRTQLATPTVDLLDYRRCDDDSAVELLRANGAGHTWPGSDTTDPATTDQTMSATSRMLAFFKQHPLGGSG